MTSFALRGLLTRKLRTALTAIAIVLGVATVSGTFILTDSIDKAFDSIFSDVYRNTDATITPKSAFDTGGDSGTTEAAFDESLLAEVKDLPDVKDAIGGVASENTQLVKDGKAIAFGGAPNLGFSVDPSKPQFNSLTLVDGKWPGANQVVIDKSTAGKKDIAVGDRDRRPGRRPRRDAPVSGLVKFGSVSSIGGATLSGFDLATAQRLFDKEGKLDQIRVAAKPGVSPQRLFEQIQTILPPGHEVRTGDAQAKEDAQDTDEFISFLRYFLLAFGVHRALRRRLRDRQLALDHDRAADARAGHAADARRVAAPGPDVGRRGSARDGRDRVDRRPLPRPRARDGLFSLFDAVGFTLPNNGLLFETRTIVVSLALGIIVTLIASFFPALRATRVPRSPPFARAPSCPPGAFRALPDAGRGDDHGARVRAARLGLFSHGTSTVLILLIVGTLLVFVGVAMLSAPFIPALSGFLGWPATWIGGAAGSLARDNARRNPQRTASTAAALMIGLALVTLVATLAAGITQTFRGAVNDIFSSDYAITAQNNYSPIPISVGETAARRPA